MVEDRTGGRDEAQSITELLVQLGRDVSVLVFCEAQLAASRNMPEVRRAARDIAGALVAAIAFLTAFVFANLAAFEGLTNGLSAWLAYSSFLERLDLAQVEADYARLLA